jgi:hypothetical protein
LKSPLDQCHKIRSLITPEKNKRKRSFARFVQSKATCSFENPPFNFTPDFVLLVFRSNYCVPSFFHPHRRCPHPRYGTQKGGRSTDHSRRRAQ